MNAIQKELKGLRHKQQLLGILLFSLVTIVVWVGISLILSQQSTRISSALQRLALPLNPSINVEVLSEIEQKRAYDPATLTNFPIYRLLSDEEAVTLGSSQPSTTSSTLLESLTALPSPSPEPDASASGETTEASPSAEVVTTPSPTPNTSPTP